MELVRSLNAGPQAPQAPQVTRTYSEDAHLAGQAAAPVPLPFDKGQALIPPPAEYICPEHHQAMRLKPGGTNRQGSPYSAGYRCPVQGCRQFVPAAGAA
jgi:hypothetical protein